MSKHNKTKIEKVLRNEVNVLRFKPKTDPKDSKPEKKIGKFANWCRLQGHPATCGCAYSKIEISAKNHPVSNGDCVNGRDCPNHPRR